MTGEARDLWKKQAGGTHQNHNVTEPHTAATDGGGLFICLSFTQQRLIGAPEPLSPQSLTVSLSSLKCPLQ